MDSALRLAEAVGRQGLAHAFVLEGEDGGGEEGGVLGAVDGHAGDRHARRHLGDGEQRVQAAADAGGGGDGHADDGQGRPGGDDTGQVGGHAGGGDDGLEAAVGGGGGELLDLRRRAVGGDDQQLVVDAQLAEGLEAG